MKKFFKLRAFQLMLLIMCALGLTACGDSDSDTGADNNQITSISVNKDGTIESRIVEDFGEVYYDETGLKNMIEEAVSDYLGQSPTSSVSLKACKANNGKINVEMEFGDYKAYAGFNGESFFSGTVKEAYSAGYDLNFTLNAVNDKNTAVISKQDILNMGDNHLVIFERVADDDDALVIEPIRINCFDDILYIGEGISTVSKKSANFTLKEGIAVVLFK